MSDLDRTANGTPHANDFLAHVEAGYRFGLSATTWLTPLIAGDVVVISRAGSPIGRGRRHLQVLSATTSSVQGVLGGQLKQAVAIGLEFSLELTVRAGWTHEFEPTDRTITASLTGTPGAFFEVVGAPVPRNAAAYEVGASVKSDGRRSLCVISAPPAEARRRRAGP